ncbi:hypothetical protein ACOME3_000448 [Neoechinorhynchus agilis]
MDSRTQFCARYKNRVTVTDVEFSQENNVSETELDLKDCRCTVYSHGGGLLLIGGDESTILLDTATKKIIHRSTHGCDSAVFSPLDSYIALHKTVYKTTAESPPNLLIFPPRSNLNPVLSFKQPSDNLWEPIWSTDEQILCVYQEPSLRFFKRCKDDTFDKDGITSLHLKNLRTFAISPTCPNTVALYCQPPKNAQHSTVQIVRRVPGADFDLEKPMNALTLAIIESVELQWTPEGSGVLTLVKNSKTSSKSYYG